jgi:DNA repair exonuclease SbcCD nuclease subunit
VLHLGDLVDRRKLITYISAKAMREKLFEEGLKRGITFHCIVGNHDSVYTNTLEVNALRELNIKSDNVKIYTRPKEVTFDGTKVLMVPWICEDNEKETLELINKTSAIFMFGHLELAGFPMYKNTPLSEHETLDKSLLEKFDAVYSGHYHTKSTVGNITYLGSSYEITWADFNDHRGFHIFDTDTKEMKPIKNPYRMFRKVFYDDKDKKTIDEVLDYRFSKCKGCYIKVVIKNMVNPAWYDVFISRLEKAGALDIQPVDDHKNLDKIENQVSLDEAEDTGVTIKKYVEGAPDVPDPQKKEKVFSCIYDLYKEALQLDSKFQ